MNAVVRRPMLNRTDVIVLLLLLLAGLKYTFGITHVLDVALYDESGYLHAGTSLRAVGWPAPEYAPLYALWYHALSLVQPDPVRLYYLNYALTTVLPPLFLYGLLRANRVPIIAGTVIAGYFLITQANFVTWPRPTHFALLIILAFVIAATRARRASSGYLLAATSALLAAYARPEYFLAFLLLFAAGAGFLVIEQRRGETSPRGWIPLGVVALGAILLLGKLGLPAFGKGGGERHFFAFAQHYALNWGVWNHLDPEGPYKPGTNFRAIAAQSFGDAETVSAAARHNPAMFLKHVATNIKNLASRFPGLFMHHENILFPLGTKFENLEARLILLGLAGFLFVRRRAWLPTLKENLGRHRLLLVSAVLLCVPAAISAVEIFPHDHYLLLPGTLLMAVAAVLLKGPDEEPPPLSLPRTALLGLGLLIAVPALSHRQEVETPIAHTIRSVQSLGITAPVHLLDAEGGYDYYQTPNYRRVAEYDKHVLFNQFRAETGLNMVVLTDRLAKDGHLAGDPEWEAFLKHPQEAGFEVREIPGTHATLLIERSILPPPGSAQ